MSSPKAKETTASSADSISPAAIARMVEHAEAAAYADQLRAAPAEWRCVAEETSAGWLLCAPTLDFVLFNRLVGWGLDSPARHDELRAALARYREAGLTHFGVQLSPAARPSHFPKWLEEEGLTPRDNWSKVYRPAGHVPPIATDLRIDAIGQHHAGSFASIACTAFAMPKTLEPWIASVVGRPGWHHYLAWDGSDPVAAAALFVHGEVGWLGVAGTLAEARRRGGQGALMARRLHDGTALGCRWFVTETGQDLPDKPNPSFHNMMRVGFRLAYQRPNYLLPVR